MYLPGMLKAAYLGCHGIPYLITSVIFPFIICSGTGIEDEKIEATDDDQVTITSLV